MGGLSFVLVCARTWFGLLWAPLGLVVAAHGLLTARELLRREVVRLPRARLEHSGGSLTRLSVSLFFGLALLSCIGLRTVPPVVAGMIVWAMSTLCSVAAGRWASLRDDGQWMAPRAHLLRYATALTIWPRRGERTEPLGCVLQTAFAMTFGLAYILVWALVELAVPTSVWVVVRVWKVALLSRPGSLSSELVGRPVRALPPATVGLAAGWFLLRAAAVLVPV